MRTKLLHFVVILALALSLVPVSLPVQAASPIAFTILHTNDMHGYLEGEKLTGGDGTTFEFGGITNAMGTVALLKQQANGNTLILDAGDFWQGTFASNRNEGRVIVNAMNLVGYDALTLGNHDFDHGQDVLKARAAEAWFPFLAANIMEETTGKPPAWVKPYIIKEVAGLRFGVIGLANSGTPVISKPSNSQGLKFVREVDAVRQVLPEVKDKSDLIVVLAHEGLDYDQRLAAEVPGIDVIVSGHTHVEQRQPKVVGAIDDHRIGVWNIEAVLDDGRREEDVELAPHEIHHRALERLLAHLAVADHHLRLRHQPGQ